MIIYLWVMSSHKLMAKCNFSLFFFGIIKKYLFFWHKFMHIYCINLSHKMVIKLVPANFFAKKCSFFYDFLCNKKKSCVFWHEFMYFHCINLWQKMIINLWAFFTHKFMAKKVFKRFSLESQIIICFWA